MKKEYDKTYRKENKDKNAKAAQRYKQKNADRIARWNMTYYMKNREAILQRRRDKKARQHKLLEERILKMVW